MARRASLIGLSLVSLAFAAPLAGQSAEGILETAMQRYEERMSGIDNYTVIQEVMGTEVASYYEKQMKDGRPVFVETGKWGAGEEQEVGEFYNMFMTVADRARTEGTETIDGYRCHAIVVDDFSGVDLYPEGDAESEDFQPRLARFYLDEDEYVIRKMYVEGDMERDGAMHPVEMEILFQNYREVEGMLHPFQTRMTMTGMNDAMSPEEREEARKSLEQLKKELAEMPDSQREMVESMMGDRIQQLEEMVNSGSIEISMQVKELKVNAGPPEGS